MVRGTSKKVYMGGKRAGKKSEEVIKDIRDSINASGKMTSEIEELLGGLLK